MSEHKFLKPGFDMNNFDAALFKLFLEFVKSSGGPDESISPILAAIANNKAYFGEVKTKLTQPNLNWPSGAMFSEP